MSKRAEEAALKAYPKEMRDKTGFVIDIGHPQWNRDYYIEGYEQAEKDLWDRIEKYLKTRHHMDYATVGWILNNLEYYKQKIMERE